MLEILEFQYLLLLISKNSLIFRKIEDFGSRKVAQKHVNSLLQHKFCRILSAIRQHKSAAGEPKEILARGIAFPRESKRLQVVLNRVDDQLTIRFLFTSNAGEDHLALTGIESEFVIPVQSSANDKCAHWKFCEAAKLKKEAYDVFYFGGFYGKVIKNDLWKIQAL